MNLTTTAATIDETPDHPAARMSWPRALLAMARPIQLALIGLIFTNGVLLAWWHGNVVVDGAALLVAAALLMIASSAAHLCNEAVDDETDRRTNRTPFSGGSGALEASGLSPRIPLVAGFALAGLAAAGTLAALLLGTIPVIAALLLMAGLAGGLAYSLPPLAMARHGLGEPLNAVLGALVLPLFGVAVVAARVSLLDIVAFLPFLWVTFASVLATAWPDRAADGSTGKSTMQVRLPPATLRLIALLSFVAFIASTVLSSAVAAMPFAMAGLLVTPLLLVGLLRYTRADSPLANVAAMVGLALTTTFVSGISLVAGA